MSAFMVGREHINVMVWAMTRQPTRFYRPFTFEHSEAGTLSVQTAAERTRLGQVLVDANAASIQARYGEDEGYRYTYRRPAHDTWHPLEIIRAVECFEYQACEVPDYYKGPTHALCTAMIERLTDEAVEQAVRGVWEISSEDQPTLYKRMNALVTA